MSPVKNISMDEVLKLEEQVDYQQHQVVSKTLVQNASISLTVFAFDKGEGLSTHASHGDAIVQILDGRAEITIDTKVFLVSAGETIILPANVPHSLFATEQFKMLLTVVF